MNVERRAPLSRNGRIALGAVVAAALALRLWHLWDQTPLDDDYFALFNSFHAGSRAEFWRSVIDNPHHLLLTPFINLLVARWSGSLFVRRLPDVLVGTAGVLLTFLLGRRLSGERTGLIAAALLAVSPIHLECSRSLEYYPWLVLLALASAITLWRAVEKGSAWSWAAYSAVLAVFASAHLYAPVVAAMQGFWLLAFRRHAVPGFALSLIVPAAIFLPWDLSLMAPILKANTFHFSRYMGWDLWDIFGRIARTWNGMSFESYDGNPDLGHARLRQAAAAVPAFAFMAGIAALTKRREWSAPWLMAAAWIPAGIAVVIILDKRADYFFAPRQTLFILPFYLLLAARGLEEIFSWMPAAARVFAAAGAAALLVVSAEANVSLGRATWARYEGAAEQLASDARPGDVLVFDNTNSAAHFLYFYDREAFLRLRPPRLYDGWYQFRLPDDLTAGRNGGRNRIFSVDDPPLTLEAEQIRWRLAGLSADHVFFAGERHPMPGGYKSAWFRRFLQPDR